MPDNKQNNVDNSVRAKRRRSSRKVSFWLTTGQLKSTYQGYCKL